ncbi:MAG: LysR family transcriptional regulator [Synergistaceae bacterium]|nr:LysR family transcriptional regulator [Synergistaceae bacterium]
MDITKCEAFVRCAESGSFTGAAEKMGYTQSGITRMVQSLEEELGCPLLIRGRQGTRPTSDGERLLPLMRELCRVNDRLTQLSAEIRGLSVGEVTVGAYFSVAACWLPSVIRAFESAQPNIRVNIVEATNLEFDKMLETGKLDCCFMSWSENMRWDWLPLREDRLMAWLPPDHPLAGESRFPIEEADGAPFIIYAPGRDTDLDRLLAEWKFKPEIRYTTLDSVTAYAMVEAGLGMSVNDELSTKRMKGCAAALPLEPPRFVSLGIAVPSLSKLSPAAKKFIACAQRVVGEL